MERNGAQTGGHPQLDPVAALSKHYTICFPMVLYLTSSLCIAMTADQCRQCGGGQVLASLADQAKLYGGFIGRNEGRKEGRKEGRTSLRSPDEGL